jgi:hypothetical protein
MIEVEQRHRRQVKGIPFSIFVASEQIVESLHAIASADDSIFHFEAMPCRGDIRKF